MIRSTTTMSKQQPLTKSNNDISLHSSSHSSTSSSSSTNINNPYSMRERRHTMALFESLSQSYESFDYYENENDENDELERNQQLSDDDDNNDNNDNNQEDESNDNIDIEVDDSTSSSKNEINNSSSRSNANTNISKKKKIENKDNEWSTDVNNINIPISSYAYANYHTHTESLSSCQLLQCFISKFITKRWVSYTNKYSIIKTGSSINTNVNELYAFISVHIYMGISYLPRIDMYWSQNFHHPFETSLFTRDRYQLLSSCFCITNPNENEIDDPASHTIEFINHLNVVFPQHYIPSQYLTFDETMCAYKGRSNIRQYIPSKPHKWGYKIWCLASNNYLLKLRLYEGATDSDSEYGKTYSLIVDFMKGYENKNHILFIDNFFTSPSLIHYLATMNIAVCGSVRLNRKGMPPSFQINKQKLKQMKRGETLHFQKDDVCLVLWKDQNILKLLYNHIQPSTKYNTLKRWGDNNEKVEMSVHQAIKDYFVNARSVDVLGQLHYSYPVNRKTVNATSSLVWWLIDICIVNAFTLYKTENKTLTHLDFRIMLMNGLAAMFLSDRSASQASSASNQRIPLAKDHYSDISCDSRRCSECSTPERRKRTTYICVDCNIHLCLGKCFAAYHSKLSTR